MNIVGADGATGASGTADSTSSSIDSTASETSATASSVTETSSGTSSISLTTSAVATAASAANFSASAALAASAAARASASAASSCCCNSNCSSAYSDDFLISMRVRVNLAAKSTFWPSLPIASGNALSGTTTSTVSSCRTVTWSTEAGLNAFVMYVGMSSLHSRMSIFSPISSVTTFCTRIPRKPTQAPIGSTSRLFDDTATLLREPAVRAMPLISTRPLLISGTSFSISRRNRSG